MLPAVEPFSVLCVCSSSSKQVSPNTHTHTAQTIRCSIQLQPYKFTHRNDLAELTYVKINMILRLESLEAFSGVRIPRNVLGQTSALKCKGFPTFRELTPSPSSGCAGCFVKHQKKNIGLFYDAIPNTHVA
jgi:hypothetical protein